MIAMDLLIVKVAKISRFKGRNIVDLKGKFYIVQKLNRSKSPYNKQISYHMMQKNLGYTLMYEVHILDVSTMLCSCLMNRGEFSIRRQGLAILLQGAVPN